MVNYNLIVDLIVVLMNESYCFEKKFLRNEFNLAQIRAIPLKCTHYTIVTSAVRGILTQAESTLHYLNKTLVCINVSCPFFVFVYS